jgi:hypothetical protein
VVVGGGLFGCYAAIHLASLGHDVLLLDKRSELMSQASTINQARVHSGLHYPRSFLTAQDSAQRFAEFTSEFPNAINSFTHVYGLSRFNSKVTATTLLKLAKKLNIEVQPIEPNKWFNLAAVSDAIEVHEPTFDIGIVSQEIKRRLETNSQVEIRKSTSLIGVSQLDPLILELSDGSRIKTNGVVIAGYSQTNSIRTLFNLPLWPLQFEQTEVLLGRIRDGMANMGFTVMDGPFFSIMPFGWSSLHSLTAVNLTPRRRASIEPLFDCQTNSNSCSASDLQDCTSCPYRPSSITDHFKQLLVRYFNSQDLFTTTTSLMTIKTILRHSHVDDARPTIVHKEPNLNLWTILSGKVSSIFLLREYLK